MMMLQSSVTAQNSDPRRWAKAWTERKELRVAVGASFVRHVAHTDAHKIMVARE